MDRISKPRVLLVYPKIDHEKDYVFFWTPFSLLTIAKVLLDENIAEVVIFDGNQSDLNDWERFLDAYLDEALCIGISIMTGGGQIHHALELVRKAKKRLTQIPIVFGGPHVNVLGEQTAQHHLVDAVLVGPGQNSMPAYVEALTGRRKLDDVPGLIIRKNNVNVDGPLNPPRTQQLGGYPWHLLNVADYLRDDPCIAPRTLNYVSSQGCIYKCRFCYELTYKRKYSAIGYIDLVNDILDLSARFDIRGVKFYDADWFIDLRRSLGFAEELINSGVGLKWAASINPNDILRAKRHHIELLPKIAISGCTRLLMGVESGSDRVLQEIVEKEITCEEILDVAKEIAQYGIIGAYTLIVGFPGETKSEEDATYELLNELRNLSPTPETRVHLFAPYPGTPLFDVAIEHGFKPPQDLEAWSSYDYYESQTPWTNVENVFRALSNTAMRSDSLKKVTQRK